MEIQERIIDRMQLENGLTLICIDQSRPIVGDRCQVQLLIKVPLQPEAAHFDKYPDPAQAFHEFTLLTRSEPFAFKVVKVRNFIDNDLAEKTIQEMKEEFFRTSLDYLKRPGFAASFITRKYEELRSVSLGSSRRQ